MDHFSLKLAKSQENFRKNNLSLEVEYIFYPFDNINKNIKKMSLSDFSIVSKIGDGLNTIVYKVLRSQDNNIYALKQVKLESMNSK